MVTEKADRLNKYSPAAQALQQKDGFFHGWPEPWTTGHALALKSKSPISANQGCFGCNQQSRFFRLGLIGITFNDSAQRDTVSGENHRNAAREVATSGFPTVAQFFGICLY